MTEKFTIDGISFLLGLFIGRWLFPRKQYFLQEKLGDGNSSTIKERVHEVFKAKPKPGVVNHLTDEEILEKHDPKAQGLKEAWRETMAVLGGKR